jgi:hypothetical protein
MSSKGERAANRRENPAGVCQLLKLPNEANFGAEIGRKALAALTAISPTRGE